MTLTCYVISQKNGFLSEAPDLVKISNSQPGKKEIDASGQCANHQNGQ